MGHAVLRFDPLKQLDFGGPIADIVRFLDLTSFDCITQAIGANAVGLLIPIQALPD